MISSNRNAAIHYFSGTGNAKNVCSWIADTFVNEFDSVKVFNISDDKIVSVTDQYTTIGFCYPTHGFNAPPIVLKYIWRFPRAKTSTRFFVVNTRAGLKAGRFFVPGISGLALLLPAVFMMLKGYKLAGYRSIDLPSNWISLHPGLKSKVVNSIYARCKRLTLAFAHKLLNDRTDLSGFWWLPIDLLLIPISFGYYFFGRFALSKTFIATSDCNNCGLCVENCPVKAIKVKDGFPYWTYKCESCMKCMNMCPKRAIETPHGFTFIIWWVAFTSVPFVIINSISGLNNYLTGPKKILSDLLFWALSIMFIFISYRIMHFLMRYRWFNNLIKFTSLTHFKFWRRYKSPKELR